MFTLIVNYFVNGKIKTEISNHKTIEDAEKKVVELQMQGYEVTRAHYGIFQISLGRAVEIR
jgi:hypothetical protein